MHDQPEEEAHSRRRTGLLDLSCAQRSGATEEHGAVRQGRRVSLILRELPSDSVWVWRELYPLNEVAELTKLN